MGWRAGELGVLEACVLCLCGTPVHAAQHRTRHLQMCTAPATASAQQHSQAPDPRWCPAALPARPALVPLPCLQEDLGATLALLAGQGAKFDKDAYICDIKVNIPDRF